MSTKATKIGPHGVLLDPLTGLPIADRVVGARPPLQRTNASGAVSPTIENITNDVIALQNMVENKSKSLPPTVYERIEYALINLRIALEQAGAKFYGGKHRSRRHHKSRHHKSRRHTRRS
jgi:hypothetical protein